MLSFSSTARFTGTLLFLLLLAVPGWSQSYRQGPIEPVNNQVLVMDSHRFEGKWIPITSDQANLGKLNDRIESISVPHGKKVIIYDLKGFDKNGRYTTLYPGRYAALGDFKNRIASIEIRDHDAKNDPVVWAFEHGDLENLWQIAQSFSVGDTDKGQLLCNDCFSEILVPADVKVTMYEHPLGEAKVGEEVRNFGGRSNSRPFVHQGGSNPLKHFDLRDYNLNDVVSGVRVRRSGYKLVAVEWKYKGTVASNLSESAIGQSNIKPGEIKGASSTVKVAAQHSVSATKTKNITTQVGTSFAVAIEQPAITGILPKVTTTLTTNLSVSTDTGKSDTEEELTSFEHSITVPADPNCITNIRVVATPEIREYEVIQKFLKMDDQGRVTNTRDTLRNISIVTVKNVSSSNIELSKDCGGQEEVLAKVPAKLDGETLDLSYLSTGTASGSSDDSGGATNSSSVTGSQSTSSTGDAGGFASGTNPPLLFTVDFEDEDGEPLRCHYFQEADGYLGEYSTGGELQDRLRVISRTELQWVLYSKDLEAYYLFDLEDEAVYEYEDAALSGEGSYVGDIITE